MGRLLLPRDVAPGAPLLTLEACREQCRVEDPAEDAALERAAAGAERHVEAVTGRRLTPRLMVAEALYTPGQRCWRVMAAPISEISAITLHQTGSAPIALDPEQYHLRQRGDLAELVLASAPPAGTQMLVELAGGYAPGECEPDLEAAALVMMAGLFDHRSSGLPGNIRWTVDALLAPWRISLGVV